jgi:tetratricopeptide (TPR) repeat protein
VPNESDHLLLEADGLFDCRRLDEALARYEEVLDLDPDSRHALNRVARIQAMRGRIRQMLKTCFRWQESLLEQGRGDLAGLVAQAILRFDPYSLEGRMGILRHLERTADESTFVTAARRDARFFVEVGRGDLAIQVLHKALEAYPDQIDLSMDLADVHMAQGHMQEAVQQFRLLGESFKDSGNLARACDSYRRLRVLLPESSEIPLMLGQLCMLQERFGDAMLEFRDALRLDLKSRDALMGLGEAAVGKGALRDAVLAFKKLLAMDPRDVQARLRLGEVFLVNGLPGDAIKEFLLAGNILSELEEFAEARQAYARVLEIEPEHPTATREFSNAGSALEARSAASTRPAAVGSEQPEAFPEEALYSPVSEEDLYVTLEGGDDSTVLGAPEDDSEELGAPESKPVVRSDYRALRYPLPPQPALGTLHDPLPFLLLSIPGLMRAVRDQIQEPPDPEVLSWLPLADLEGAEEDDALGNGDGAGIRGIIEPSIPVLVSSAPAGPVESAFGFTKGFSQSIVSTGGSSRRRRLRRQLEELGLGRVVRAPVSAETDVAASLAERIAQKVRQQEDSDES